jgi:hypothetical protein
MEDGGAENRSPPRVAEAAAGQASLAQAVGIADMEPRVAAAEAKIRAAAQEGEKRKSRLLDRLDTVQKALAHKQRRIHRLEEEQGRSLDEVKHLKTLLGDSLGETAKARKKKRLGKLVAYLGLMSWLATAAVFADKVHRDTMNDALKGALVRSQVTRHELSQELARVAAELQAMRERRDLYRSRETQSAAAP